VKLQGWTINIFNDWRETSKQIDHVKRAETAASQPNPFLSFVLSN